MHTKWKSLTSALLGVTFALAAAGSAFAADAYQRGSTKDAPTSYEAPIQSDAVKWSGFYGAAAVGYGQSSTNVDVSYHAETEEGPVSQSIFGLNGISGTGAVAEVELGYDVRLPSSDFVIGVLGGYRWSGIETTAHFGEFNASQEGDTAWWAGGRAGVLINDSKSALLYAKGVYIDSDPDKLNFTGGSFDLDGRSGWGVGGGLEVAVRSAPGLFIRGEYMHYAFDENTYALAENVNLNLESSEDIGKIGLVYKINALGN